MKKLFLNLIFVFCNLFAAEQPDPKTQFNQMLKSGEIIQTEQNDTRQMFRIIIHADTITNAYKGEILNYLKTGIFQFNEDLQDD